MNSRTNQFASAPLAVALIGTVTLCIVAFMRAGAMPALAVLVGEISAIVSVLGLAALGKVLNAVQAPPKSGTGWMLIVGVFKMPLVLGGLYLAARLAGPEPVPLIIAVILVYLCFVWFLAQSRARA